MIPRTLEKELHDLAQKYPVIAVLGPRQSGKTTLVQHAFPQKPYVSLEQIVMRNFANQDPNGFLENYPNGAVIDEVQRAPELFSYIQGIVDEKKKEGFFVLSGSQNFLLMEQISQSLAGRIALLRLLPFSIKELQSAKKIPSNLNNLLFKGGYPRIYDKSLNPTKWFSNYLETYVERDVRILRNIGNLFTFSRFLKMCAHRVGQILNLSSLANDCGITHNTARDWISILEASFIVFLIQPHFKNFNKRLVKSPKLYFYDSGFLCFLLGIKKSSEISLHDKKGGIFESFIFSEIMKKAFNKGQKLDLYFWRDKLGREIDCILDLGKKIIPLEIKAGQTITSEYFKNLKYWITLANYKEKLLFWYMRDDQSKNGNKSKY